MRTIPSLALTAAVVAAPVWAQKMPDIGFESVGRGRPLAASVHDQPPVGPGWTGTAFVQTPGQFYLVRFLLGVAEAGFFPGIIVYFTHWFPMRDRARAMCPSCSR